MNDDLCRREDIFNGVVSGVAEGDVVGISSGARLIPIDVAVTENHTVVVFVADLYPFRFDAIVFERL